MIFLIKQQFKINLFALSIWSLVIFFMTITTGLMFPQIKEQSAEMQKLLDSMEFLESITGNLLLTSYDGFMIMKNFSMLPFLLSFYVIVFSCQMISREMDNGSIEYSLALPIKRSQFILSKVIVMFLNVFILNLVTVLATILGRIIINEEGLTKEFFIIMMVSWLLSNLLGNIVLFISLFINDYTKSLMIGFGFIIFFYLMDVALHSVEKFESLKMINPFYHFKADQIFHGTNDMTINLAYLLIGNLLFLFLSILFFNKKQINP